MKVAIILSTLAAASAFAPATTGPAFARTSSSALSASPESTRLDFVKNIGTATAAAAFASLAPVAPASAGETVTLPSGVVYEIVKSGDGPAPSVGEMAAVRFKAQCGDNVIDDIFSTAEPYYTRVGSGGLIKGVEEVIPKMRVGDRFVLTVPGPLAFGKKGRPASAGKPRIPSDATIIFDVEMVGLPGKEIELIELIGDE